MEATVYYAAVTEATKETCRTDHSPASLSRVQSDPKPPESDPRAIR